MSHKGEAYSASGAIFLDNPIRRLLQPPSRLIEMLAINSGDVVMDFGCGPGFFTIELAKKAKRVVAVDLSPEMLKTKRLNLRSKILIFCKVTARKFSLRMSQLIWFFL